MDAKQAAKALKKEIGKAVTGTKSFRGEETVVVTLDALRGALEQCHSKLGFDFLVDLSGVDNLGEDPRYEVVYELYSYKHGCNLRVKAGVDEAEREAPSVADLWPTANWHEREAYDMFGITFTGHPDLRRILMWEGFPFFPLRKDFPLAGKPSEMPDVAWSDAAPLEGGPFVTAPSSASTVHREPRARS